MNEKVASNQEPTVDTSQKVETNAYVPTYRVLPKFKQELLRILGKYPYNQIAGIMGAINVEVMDHNTLTQVINVLGNFPYELINSFLENINNYVEQIVED